MLRVWELFETDLGLVWSHPNTLLLMIVNCPKYNSRLHHVLRGPEVPIEAQCRLGFRVWGSSAFRFVVSI